MREKNKKLLSAMGGIYKEETKKRDEIFSLERSKDGSDTLLIHIDDNKYYLHSRYNPIREAGSIGDKYKDINEDKLIIFIGTGLGYHIEEILKNNPRNKFYIYEPIDQIFDEFIRTFDLEKYKENLLGISVGKKTYGRGIEKVIDIYGDFEFIFLPSHNKYFREENERFTKDILKYLETKLSNLATNLNFQETWIVNIMKNLKYNLSSNNILINNINKMSDYTAILVAAGPSLNYEIDNLKKIKKDKSAIIFAAGSTINALINNGIYPDYLVSLDPGEPNVESMSIVGDKKIDSIPLIYGTSIAHRILPNYPGEIHHLVTSQDSISNYFLKLGEDELENIYISDRSTIANFTLDFLRHLGFKDIVLVGQNFAYMEGETHARGRDSDHLSDEDMKKALEVEDVYGGRAYTNRTYNIMREEMEEHIAYHKDFYNIINTSKYGAAIKGTRFKELEDVIREDLKVNSISGYKDKLDLNKTEYNKEYLSRQNRRLRREYKDLERLNKEYNKTLDKIKRDKNLKNYSRLEKLYPKLNNNLRKIENNDFYINIILPTVRVQYENLANKIDKFNEIRDPDVKAGEIYNNFKLFIELCIKEIDIITPIYNEMVGDIEKYIIEEDVYAK